MSIKFDDYFTFYIEKKRVWVVDFMLDDKGFTTFLAKNPKNQWAIFSISKHESSSTDDNTFNERVLQEKVIELFRVRLLAKGERFTNPFLFIESTNPGAAYDWADGFYTKAMK